MLQNSKIPLNYHQRQGVIHSLDRVEMITNPAVVLVRADAIKGPCCVPCNRNLAVAKAKYQTRRVSHGQRTWDIRESSKSLK